MLVIVASPSFPHTLVMHCLNYELTVLPKIYHCLTRVSVYLAMQITCISHTATRDRNLKKNPEINKYFVSFPTFTLLHQVLLSRVSERVKINVFNSTSYCNYFKSETETKNRLTLWSIRIFRNQPYWWSSARKSTPKTEQQRREIFVRSLSPALSSSSRVQETKWQVQYKLTVGTLQNIKVNYKRRKSLNYNLSNTSLLASTAYTEVPFCFLS